jgi:hypothetical protein
MVDRNTAQARLMGVRARHDEPSQYEIEDGKSWLLSLTPFAAFVPAAGQAMFPDL